MTTQRPHDPASSFQPKPQREAPRPAFVNAQDLDGKEFPPVEWIVEGLVPTGLNLLVGKSKIGKSWLAMDLAIAVALGEPAFTSIRTSQCEVLYLALEDPERRLQTRMRQLCNGHGVPAGLTFANTWPIGLGCVEALVAYLDNNPGCRFIIVDTFGKVRGQANTRNANAYQQDYVDIGLFQTIASQRNVAITLVHHTRKQASDDVFDSVSGTTAIMGGADAVMILQRKRGSQDGTLDITGRDIVDDTQLAVTFDRETCKWSILGPAADIEKETTQQAVYNLILAQSDPIGPSDIAAELQIKMGTVKSALARLKKRGSIKKLARGLWAIADE